MRVLVCGGRDFDDEKKLFSELFRIHEKKEISCIIEGGQRGADALAALWSANVGLTEHASFSANWKLHGRAAGPLRNARMIKEGRPDLVVAFAGGNGTADLVRRAKAAGIEVIEVTG